MVAIKASKKKEISLYTREYTVGPNLTLAELPTASKDLQRLETEVITKDVTLI
jgi:hypothetical protein